MLVHHIDLYDRALKAAVAALEAAATAMHTLILLNYEDDDYIDGSAATAFKGAEEKVKACFEKYNVSSCSEDMLLAVKI